MLNEQFSTFKKAFPWVVFVSSMFFLSYLNRAILGPIIPFLKVALNINDSQATSFFLYVAFGHAFSVTASIKTCSLLAPRKIVCLSTICSGICVCCISFSNSLIMFNILFLLMGISAGQYFNAGMSSLRSLVKTIDIPKAISIHELGPALSFIVAPSIVGLITPVLGWRYTFLILGIINIVSGILFIIFSKGGRSTPSPISISGITDVLKNPRCWLFTWLLLVGIGGELGPYSILSLYMEKELNFSLETSSFLLTATRIIAPTSLLFGGWITSRSDTKTIINYCVFFYALGLFLMAIPYKSTLVVGMILQPLATVMSFPAIFNVVVESFKFKEQPALLALCTPVASLIGAGVVPKFLGIFGTFGSYRYGFAVLGVIVLLTFVFMRSYKKYYFDEE